MALNLIDDVLDVHLLSGRQALLADPPQRIPVQLALDVMAAH